MRFWAVIAAPALLVSLATSEPARPPQRLDETGLYVPGRPGVIDPRNRAFTPQYPLWSDGLLKQRWIYLPPGKSIDVTDEHNWVFPEGTRFWKEFSLGGRRIETRMSTRARDGHWVFVTYVWNEEGTEAVLAPDEGIPGVVEVAEGRRHSLPSRTDCTACHGTRETRPLGFDALQLSTDRDPNAIHGEPLAAGMTTLRTLVEEGLLAGQRQDLLADPPRIRTSSPQTRAVLGYLAANCGACHNGNGEVAALGPVIRYAELLKDGDGVARSLLGRRTKWQVPGVPDGESVLIHPGSPERSAIYARMRSRAPSSQMPPLGTVISDQKALDAITRWIAGGLVGSSQRPGAASR